MNITTFKMSVIRNTSRLSPSEKQVFFSLGERREEFRMTGQLHESLIKLYFKQFSIFQLFSWIKVKVLISFA
jgi:hypothetical protein